MQAHTRKHHIDKTLYTSVDSDDNIPMSIEDFIQENIALPTWAIILRGLRNREGLSQTKLGEFLGIAQTNISQMELGKRAIGKTLAKKIANFFKTDYHLFL